MRSAALLRYDLAKATETFSALRWPSIVAECQAIKVIKLREKLVAAERREMRQLAKVLTYKADIYGPLGRIYSHEAKWRVVVAACGSPVLFHGDNIINPDNLTDGHGNTITT